MRRIFDSIGAVATAAVSASGARQVLGLLPPKGRKQWVRTNHRGQDVNLLAGPAAVAGLLLGGQVNGSIADRAALSVAVLSGGASGLVDDHLEEELNPDQAKGFLGHLEALRHGTVTTGAVKMIGIGAGSALAVLVLPWQGKSARAKINQKFVDAVLIAGTANLLNLLDLRPGRALKAAGLASVPLLITKAAPMAGTILGTCTALLEADLDERDMLGDTGANAIGAALGVALVRGLSPMARRAALLGIIGLNVASEKISFSDVIDRSPVLHHLDEWGREPKAS